MFQVSPARGYHPLEDEQAGERISVLYLRLELPELLDHGRQGYIISLTQHRDVTEFGESGCDALLVS
jgi:hypothetical protein